MFRHNTHPEENPPLRVLYVDDNRDAADTAVDLLRVCGFEPRASYNGPAALAEAASFRQSVCLIDLNMPGMDGVELAVRLRADAGGEPLVLVAVTAKEPDCRTCTGTSSGVRRPGARVCSSPSGVLSPALATVSSCTRTCTANGRSLATVSTSGASLEARL